MSVSTAQILMGAMFAIIGFIGFGWSIIAYQNMEDHYWDFVDETYKYRRNYMLSMIVLTIGIVGLLATLAWAIL